MPTMGMRSEMVKKLRNAALWADNRCNAWLRVASVIVRSTVFQSNGVLRTTSLQRVDTWDASTAKGMRDLGVIFAYVP